MGGLRGFLEDDPPERVPVVEAQNPEPPSVSPGGVQGANPPVGLECGQKTTTVQNRGLLIKDHRPLHPSDLRAALNNNHLGPGGEDLIVLVVHDTVCYGICGSRSTGM